MKKLEFRKLEANDIDCRVSTITDKGCSLLLYKNARCDMNILDETVGAMNWQRSHTRDNANCIVSIWDDEKGQWISKEDTGTESYTEKEKGLASDSFKRACFNWGIGRELYTAPFIWVSNVKIEERNRKKTTKDKFYVSDITYKDGRIDTLVIKNEKTNVVVFEKRSNSNDNVSEYITESQYKELSKLCKEADREESYIAKSFKVESLMVLKSEDFAKTKAGLMKIINDKKAKE